MATVGVKGLSIFCTT